MDKGWVKLHRAIHENVFLMKDNNACLVFMRLLLIVGKNKGEWAGGRIQLSDKLNMNPNTLYKVLKRLEREQMIMIESNTKYTTYRICNWKKYQGNGNSEKGSRVTAREQPGNSRVTTREHSNKNREGRIKKDFNNDEEKTTGRATRATVAKIRKDLIDRKVLK